VGAIMIIYKTLDEIKKIDKANEIIIKLYSEVLPKYVKAGISTYELDQITEDFIRSNGAIPGTKGYEIGKPYPAYPASLCTSVNNRVVHGIPTKTEILKNGDIISLDTVAVLDGFYGDAAITVPVGEIDENAKKLLEVTEKARERTGVKIEDGMVIAIEPMVNEGAYQVRILPDMWTVITKDGKRSAHSEYSVAIVNGKPIKLGTGEL
jgi:methionyl aminopeptidase